jgi:K+-sensing histidine kinase KdpD
MAVLFLGGVLLAIAASLVTFAGLVAWAADRVAWNRWHALGAAALATLVYDWLVVPPVFSLICESEEGWAAVALFFVTAAVASELSVRWK